MSLTQTGPRTLPAGRGGRCRAPLCGYLELHPVAGVDCHVVRALQEAVEGQRWVVTGVNVPFRIREAHTAESWREALELGRGAIVSQRGCGVEQGHWGNLGSPVSIPPKAAHSPSAPQSNDNQSSKS